MALTEQVQLDITQAQRQISQLEQQLAVLQSPVVVPVTVEQTGADIDRLQREIAQVDNNDISIDVNTGELSQAEREIADMQAEIRDAVDSADRFADEMDRVGREAEQAGRRGSNAFGSLGTSLKGLAISAGAFIGLREIGRFFNESIQAASDLEESTSKAQVVFGSFFDDIEAFAATAPQALGLANAEALEFTGTFGNLFTALGLSQQAAADLSPDIVQLGADLASFNNIDVTDALDKLRAGLVGEAEPLRTLGVNINAAVVEAKALELGLGGLTGELSEAEKVQARYAIILEQTTNAQGDFARTSEGIANRQRTFNAEIQELQQQVGQALLPVFEQLLASAQDLLPAIENMIPAFADAASNIGATVGPVLELLEPLAQLVGLLGSIRTASQELIQSEDPFQRLHGSILDLSTTGAISGFFSTLENLRFFLETGLPLDVLKGQIEDFHTAIDEGANPERNLIRFLQNLSSQGTLTESTLAAITEGIELTAAQAAGIRIGAREGLFGDLTPEEIDAINAALERFLDVDVRFTGRQTAGGRFADDFREVGPVINDTIPVIDEFSRAIFEAGQAEFQLNIEGEIARLEQQFAQLPSAFDGVREALRNEEGEIVGDFGDFADNLIGELQAQLDFVNNINLLREMGFDDLADQFADLGVEYAGLLADGLADPAALAEAEAAIDGYERAIDDAMTASSGSIIAAIDSVNDLIDALDLLENVSITASVFLELTGPGAQFAGSFGTGSGRTSELVGGQTQVPTSNVTVNQTFTDPTTPSTTTARASQSINGLVSGPQ